MDGEPDDDGRPTLPRKARYYDDEPEELVVPRLTFARERELPAEVSVYVSPPAPPERPGVQPGRLRIELTPAQSIANGGGRVNALSPALRWRKPEQHHLTTRDAEHWGAQVKAPA
jgi:hypothetical protein